MDSKRLFGGILILAGIAFVFYGVNELNSVSSKLFRLVGQTNNGAYMAIAGGVIAAIAGLGLMFSSRSKS